MVGCPIRTPADHILFADPRSFSQLITSFFASESLGILHTLLFTSSLAADKSLHASCRSLLLHRAFRSLSATYLCARFTREVYPFRIAPEVFDPFFLLFYHNMSMNSLMVLSSTACQDGSPDSRSAASINADN